MQAKKFLYFKFFFICNIEKNQPISFCFRRLFIFGTWPPTSSSSRDALNSRISCCATRCWISRFWRTASASPPICRIDGEIMERRGSVELKFENFWIKHFKKIIAFIYNKFSMLWMMVIYIPSFRWFVGVPCE